MLSAISLPGTQHVCSGEIIDDWMNEWMLNDTPARKQFGYWVSEYGKIDDMIDFRQFANTLDMIL